MQLRCYRNQFHSLVDAAEFAVFRAESKYVMGVSVNGDEYLLLPDRLSLKQLLSSVPGLMRVSRSVLVARRHVEMVAGTGHERCVHVAGKHYKLSREELSERFESAAIENAQVFLVEQNRVMAISRSRVMWSLPVRVRLTHLERMLPGLMRLNRSVLVARNQVECVTFSCDERRVHVFGMVYNLPQEVDEVPFQIAATENSKERSVLFSSLRYQPGHPGLPLISIQMNSHAMGA
ncbi:hypothetical protein [Pseudomonas sp. NPDC089569]|uniref:hypothetical protein n=1 Tax=Pseudomonas sp. NPDC089569 TaxID=3390722 RepID=UPI003D08D9A9